MKKAVIEVFTESTEEYNEYEIPYNGKDSISSLIGQTAVKATGDKDAGFIMDGTVPVKDEGPHKGRMIFIGYWGRFNPLSKINVLSNVPFIKMSGRLGVTVAIVDE